MRSASAALSVRLQALLRGDGFSRTANVSLFDDHGLIDLMREVTISKFKAKCFSLLSQVQKTQQPLRVTRFGKPIAEIVPAAPQPNRAEWIGSMKGTFEILGDIVSPANDEQDWQVLRD
jgi:prevent-host-death family protein